MGDHKITMAAATSSVGLVFLGMNSFHEIYSCLQLTLRSLILLVASHSEIAREAHQSLISSPSFYPQLRPYWPWMWCGDWYRHDWPTHRYPKSGTCRARFEFSLPVPDQYLPDDQSYGTTNSATDDANQVLAEMGSCIFRIVMLWILWIALDAISFAPVHSRNHRLEFFLFACSFILA